MSTVTKVETDWQGKPVPEGETDDTVIDVWEVSPHPDGYHDFAVVRSWQDVNRFLTDVPEMYLDGKSPADCREGVTITIRTRSMTLREYRDIEASAE